MTDADRPAFVAALSELAATKSTKGLSTEQFAAWWNALRAKWTLEEFRAACVYLRDHHEFMPNPYHFEQLRQRATLDTDGEAWARARAHARSLPMHGGLLVETSSGDEKLDAVVRCIGGYRAIANATERDFLCDTRRCRRTTETDMRRRTST